MIKSRKTTIAGILVALGLCFGFLSRILDGDPTTVVSSTEWGTLVAAVGALLTGFFARDDNVSSEGTKAEKAGKKN